MENKCEECGGELINGQMAGMHGMFFYPEGEIKKLKPKRSSVFVIAVRVVDLFRSLQLKRLRNYCRKKYEVLKLTKEMFVVCMGIGLFFL